MRKAEIYPFVALCLTAVLLLISGEKISSKKIRANRQQELQLAAATLVEAAESLTWQQADPGSGPLRSYSKIVDGWLFEMSAQGYAAPFRLVAHYQMNGELLAMQVFEQNETPGFGTRIGRSWYGEIFSGYGSPENPFPHRQSQLPQPMHDAVSGATISFRAVLQTLKEGSTLAIQMTERWSNG